MVKKAFHRPHCLWGILVLALLSVGGCNYSQAPPYLTQKPLAADVVGTWEPTSETIADMKTLGGYRVSTHQIILRPDGTFSMLNMPDCVRSDSWGWDSSHRKFKSGSGRWRIVTFDNEGTAVWDIDFDFNTQGRPPIGGSSGPTLVWQNNSYLLHFGIGDEDMSDAANFRKK